MFVTSDVDQRDPEVLSVDDECIEVRAGDADALDVLLDGRRVWSVYPAKHPRSRQGVRRVPWPPGLRPRLDGEAFVEVRRHSSGEVISAKEVRFGDRAGRVNLVDEAGRPLVVNKWGRLARSFEVTDRAELEGYLDQTQEVLDTIRDECGVQGFLCFGALLGAVRTGKLIGHDVDIDLGYLSEYSHPADVMREGFQIERVLRSKGWDVVRENGGFLALFLPQSGGGRRNLDLFTAFCVEDHLYQLNDVGTVADRSAILPLGEITLEGRQWPAPAKPEVLFEAAYGPGWRVPDPAFEFDTADFTKRRFFGWLGGLRGRRDYWKRFYGGAESSRVPREPSDFAQWVAGEKPPGRLVDVGSGNGRDAYYLAGQGFDVAGFDLVPRAARGSGRGRRKGAANPRFAQLNLSSLRETLVTGARLAHEQGYRTVYGRFVLHALVDEARENFWRLTSMVLSGGGRCYLEFRTDRDRDTPKAFGEHFRRYLDPDLVAQEAAHHGGKVIHREEGRNLARFEKENPHVCRLVLEWNA